jgi:hypothetical protein
MLLPQRLTAVALLHMGGGSTGTDRGVPLFVCCSVARRLMEQLLMEPPCDYCAVAPQLPSLGCLSRLNNIWQHCIVLLLRRPRLEVGMAASRPLVGHPSCVLNGDGL